MKLKKLLFYISIVLSVFLIYKVTFKDKVSYVALGDFLTEGVNPYGQMDYSYSDFLSDYFRSEDRLKSYTNEYSNKTYTIDNVLKDIDSNYKGIKKALRESTLVTISIGANDFINSVSYKDLNNIQLLKSKIDSISSKLDNLIKEIKKYAKGDIILVGYYNPYINDNYNLDEIVDYLDYKYGEVSSNNKIEFVSIKNTLIDRKICFPNPKSISPSITCQIKIYEEIKKMLQK